MTWLSLIPLLAAALTAQAVYVDITTRDALDRLRLGSLVDLIEKAGLSQTLDDPSSNLTIFAPTDRAIQVGLRNLGLDIDDLLKNNDLKNILLYHVTPGHMTTKDFTNEKILTMATDQPLRINHYLTNNAYFANGAKLLNRNIETKNGVIHTISGILFPFGGNVYEVIGNDTDLSTLKAAIDAAGLAPVLMDQNPITIFCPTNSAFSKLGSVVPKLLNNVTLLTEILMYHVIPGSLYRGDFHDASLHTFEENDRIEMDHHSNYDEVDDARFTKYDISARNGVVHKLNSVLLPDSLLDQIKNL